MLRRERFGGMFGNRNGGGVTVFLGRADGKAEKAFYYSAFGAKIDYVGKQAKLYLGMAGTYCGQTPESEKRDGYEKMQPTVEMERQIAPVSNRHANQAYRPALVVTRLSDGLKRTVYATIAALNFLLIRKP